MNRHHLAMHRQRRVGAVATATNLTSVLLILLKILLLRLRFRLRLQALLQLSKGRPIKRASCKRAGLQVRRLEARAVGVEALANDLAAADDDGTVAVVEGRELGLSETEGQDGVVSWRHFLGW